MAKEKKPAHEVIMDKIGALVEGFSRESFDSNKYNLSEANMNMRRIEHLSSLFSVLEEMIIPEDVLVETVDKLFSLAKMLEEKDALNENGLCAWLRDTAQKISP